MTNKLELNAEPTELVSVRTLSHAAIQWPSRAARANLTARSDDSHSSLAWSDEHAALLGEPLASQRLQLGFSFNDGALIWLQDGRVVDTLALAGLDEASAGAWCDDHLLSAGLNPTAAAEMPYTLASVTYAGLTGADASLRTLGAWFAATQVALDALVAAHASETVSAPSVRCWPHHYDLATLFALDEGDPETARSIGIGVSPGDDFYAEPYLYCNPWPVPGRALPEPPQPLLWHTEGFTSLVCPASRIGGAENLIPLTDKAFSTVLRVLRQ